MTLTSKIEWKCFCVWLSLTNRWKECVKTNKNIIRYDFWAGICGTYRNCKKSDKSPAFVSRRIVDAPGNAISPASFDAGIAVSSEPNRSVSRYGGGIRCHFHREWCWIGWYILERELRACRHPSSEFVMGSIFPLLNYPPPLLGPGISAHH